LDFLLKLLETWEIRTGSLLKYLDDLLELWFLKSLSQDNQVGVSLVPISDLIEWALNGGIGWRILVRDELLDLSGPIDNIGLESLKEILIFG
jgi:hypothetical protein